MCGDIMNIINFLFSWDWCDQEGVRDVFHLAKSVLDVVRIAVPIALIALTTMDIIKKVIDPEEKEGQKKIMTRAIAALIVFIIPTLVKITFKIIDWGMGRDGSYDNAESGLSKCWR